MRIGIMGGTFDPIHMGHLIAAEQARAGAKLDEVWFIPTNVPPHKANAPKASPAERLEMVQLAIAEHEAFRAEDIELRREGASYTFDTICELRQQRTDDEFFLIIGADMVNDLPNWYRIADLAALLIFIGLKRPGYELELTALPSFIAERVMLVEMPQIGISSTCIRQRLAKGQSVRYLVPEAVRLAIEESKRYDIRTMA